MHKFIGVICSVPLCSLPPPSARSNIKDQGFIETDPKQAGGPGLFLLRIPAAQLGCEATVRSTRQPLLP